MSDSLVGRYTIDEFVHEKVRCGYKLSKKALEAIERGTFVEKGGREPVKRYGDIVVEDLGSMTSEEFARIGKVGEEEMLELAALFENEGVYFADKVADKPSDKEER